MKVAVDTALVLAVAAAWLSALAFPRLNTRLERLHVVTFVNVAVGGLTVLAACLSDGLSPRSLECMLIWCASLLGGSLLSHVTGRAIHLRSGEKR